MSDRARARTILSALRDYGVRIAVDDFGTGYSSLAYLRDLPIDELKLDRSFVMPMSDDPRAVALVSSVISLAHSIGLLLVAEGVENGHVYRTLARVGCDQAQGYYLARPLPADRLERWLVDREQRAEVPHASAACHDTGLGHRSHALRPGVGGPAPRRGARHGRDDRAARVDGARPALGRRAWRGPSACPWGHGSTAPRPRGSGTCSPAPPPGGRPAPCCGRGRPRAGPPGRPKEGVGRLARGGVGGAAGLQPAARAASAARALDAGIVTVAAAIMTYVFVAYPAWADGSGPQRWFDAAHPLAFTLLFGVLARLAYLPGPGQLASRGSAGLMGLVLVYQSVAHGTDWPVLDNRPMAGSAYWLGAFVLLGSLATHPDMRTYTERPAAGRSARLDAGGRHGRRGLVIGPGAVGARLLEGTPFPVAVPAVLYVVLVAFVTSRTLVSSRTSTTRPSPMTSRGCPTGERCCEPETRLRRPRPTRRCSCSTSTGSRRSTTRSATTQVTLLVQVARGCAPAARRRPPRAPRRRRVRDPARVRRARGGRRRRPLPAGRPRSRPSTSTSSRAHPREHRHRPLPEHGADLGPCCAGRTWPCTGQGVRGLWCTTTRRRQRRSAPACPRSSAGARPGQLVLHFQPKVDLATGEVSASRRSCAGSTPSGPALSRRVPRRRRARRPDAGHDRPCARPGPRPGRPVAGPRDGAEGGGEPLGQQACVDVGPSRPGRGDAGRAAACPPASTSRSPRD